MTSLRLKKTIQILEDLYGLGIIDKSEFILRITKVHSKYISQLSQDAFSTLIICQDVY